MLGCVICDAVFTKTDSTTSTCTLTVISQLRLKQRLTIHVTHRQTEQTYGQTNQLNY